MNEKNKTGGGNYDFVNSRALFVLKIITMAFAILAFVIVATAMLTRWISDLNNKVKESNTQAAKAAARLEKFRKARIKHILRQRKLQLKEEKYDRKKNNKTRELRAAASEAASAAASAKTKNDIGDIDSIDSIENIVNDFDNELNEIMLERLDGEI
jgi:uncharacterized membrane protein YhiD involved in acid resistance